MSTPFPVVKEVVSPRSAADSRLRPHLLTVWEALPDAVRAEAQVRSWQGQSGTPLDEPWPLAEWPDVPMRVLAGRHDRMFPLDFQRRIARERLGLEVDEIDGGHMLALSNPRGLANRLLAYLASLRGAPGHGHTST